MPALSWDAKLAEALYMSGLSTCKIAKRLKIPEKKVFSYANRHQWKNLRSGKTPRAIVKNTTQDLLPSATPQDLSLPILSEDARMRLAREIDIHTRLLAETTPCTLLELADAKQGRAGLVKVILENATRLHQWDKETPQTILQVGTVTNMNVLVQGPQDASGGPATPQQVVVEADCKVFSEGEKPQSTQ